MQKKLELAQLKNYLGTRLKIEKSYTYRNGRTDIGVTSLDQATVMYLTMNKSYDYIKPIMYRLSDLDKFIPELGFVPAERLYPIDTDFEKDLGITSKDHLEMSLNYGINGFTWDNIQKLFEWHFWVFDQSYFEEGLIIDKLK
jgi:hypothetical protein